MLGDRIRELRMAKRLNQVELATLLGVTKQSVSNWENENIQPSIEMLVRLADVLRVSTDYLLSREDKTYIEVSGLSGDEIQHIQFIIDDIKRNK